MMIIMIITTRNNEIDIYIYIYMQINQYIPKERRPCAATRPPTSRSSCSKVV